MNNYMKNDLAMFHDYISDLQLGDAIIPVYPKELRGKIVKIWNGRYQAIAIVPESSPNKVKLYYANGAQGCFKPVHYKDEFYSEMTSEEAAEWKQFLRNYSKTLKNN